MIACPDGRTRTALSLVLMFAVLFAVGVSAAERGDVMSDDGPAHATRTHAPPIDAAAPGTVETAAFAFG